MDQPRPPSFNMGLGMMGAMPMAPPMSMMLPATMPSGKVSGETAVMQRMPQNMMYCYNPLMIPSPMRMMMPMVAPPMMMPMVPVVQPTLPAPAPPAQPDDNTPLDLSTKPKRHHRQQDMLMERKQDSQSSSPIKGTHIATGELSLSQEHLANPNPYYKKNILKRYYQGT